MSGNSRDDATRPQDALLPEGESGVAVVAVWDGGYRRLPLIGPGAVDIGRGEQCDLRIDHPSVSRHHLRLHMGDELRIEDMGSSNGSRLNGVAITPRELHPLGPGDVVELGTALLLVMPGAGLDAPRPERAPASDGGRAAIARLERLIDLVAQSRINVLVVGETGSGKEVTAAAIHHRSPRADKPFITVNCAALPEMLLEAELFGFERGAFTGADRQKPGLLEAAHGGTFFLDEVGELSPPTQAKLLRVIERREVQRLGALAPRQIDVRFIAATNRDLAALAAQGHFRSDLLYRLNGITLAVPPLRERVWQISELTKTFVAAAAAADHGRTAPPIMRDAMTALEHHTWPGNIRELKNTIERAVLFSDGGPIRAKDIQIEGSLAPSAEPAQLGRHALRRDYAEFERTRILAALEQAAGNQTEAAKQLGVSRRTLMNRLDALGLPRPRKRPR